MQAKQIVLKNLLVSYYSNNKASDTGINLIFLHGWQSDGAIWFPVINVSDLKDFSIFCVDLPGFGKSQTPETPFGVSDYSDVIEEFIKKMNLRRNCLVGHSFGGRIAIKLAAARPDLIDRLVLADSAGIRVKTPAISIKNVLAKIGKVVFSAPLIKRARPYFYKLIASEDYLAASPEMRNILVRVVNEDLTPLFRDIKSKTLIFWGELDKETPIDFAYKMRENIQNARLEILKNAGHFSFLDSPGEFVKILNQFLSDAS